MKTQLFARQGDVGFIARSIPAGAKRIEVRPLALGEVTGHSHQVAFADHAGVEMFEVAGDDAMRIFMRVTADGAISIVHEEHKTVKLPKRWEGEAVTAREYDEEVDFRPVVD